MATRGSFHALIGGASALLAGCEGQPMARVPDASFDAIPCEMRTPVEAPRAIQETFTALCPSMWWYDPWDFEESMRLPNGDLLRTGECMFVARADGSLRTTFQPPFEIDLTSDGERAFYVSDHLRSAAEPHPAAYNLGLFALGSGEVIAHAVAEPIDQTCAHVGPYSPVISDGRLLVLREACRTRSGLAYALERWQQEGALLTRTFEPVPAPVLSDSYRDVPPVAADGHGGLWYVGLLRSDPDAEYTRTNSWERTVHAVHWDGTDTPPAVSAPLGAAPREGHFPRGTSAKVLSGGDLLMTIEDEQAAWVVRVRSDMSLAWTWSPPEGFFPGIAGAAVDVVGEETRLLLVDTATASQLFMQTLDARGETHSAPVPLSRVESGRIVNARLQYVGDGSFFVYTATNTYENELSHHQADGTQTMLTTELPSAAGNDWRLYDDGGLGVWLTGHWGIQHYDQAGWPLYRQWSYGAYCGPRPGIVARTGPDAEPMTYFDERGWP